MTWHDNMTANERRKFEALEKKALKSRDDLKAFRKEQERIKQAVLYRMRVKERKDE